VHGVSAWRWHQHLPPIHRHPTPIASTELI